MRSPHSETLLSVRHALAPTIKALQQHNFLWGHIFLVVELVALVWCHGKGLTLDLVAFSGRVLVGVRQNLLPAIVRIDGICTFWIEKIGSDEVVWGGGAPVDDCERKIGSGVLNRTPDVDDLIPAFDQLICFARREMASHTDFCRSRCLVNVNLLHGLSRRVFLASPDGVIEDDNPLDARDLVS